MHKDPFWIRFAQLALLIGVSVAAVSAYVYADTVIHQIHLAFAKYGHAEAQHKIAQRYLQGIGVEQSHKKANAWFAKAAAQGHSAAQYNLAVAHMKKHHKLKRG